MLARRTAAPPLPLASVAPEVPRRLAQVIDRCLLKEPTARFTSGAHLADTVRLAVAVPVGPPIALRAFLVESRQLSAPALVYGTLLGLAVPLLVMQLVTSAELGARLVAAGFIVWLFVLPTVLMVSRVRRLCAAGVRRDDPTDALAAELVGPRGELAFLYGEGPSRPGRVLGRDRKSGGEGKRGDFGGGRILKKKKKKKEVLEYSYKKKQINGKSKYVNSYDMYINNLMNRRSS